MRHVIIMMTVCVQHKNSLLSLLRPLDFLDLCPFRLVPEHPAARITSGSAGGMQRRRVCVYLRREGVYHFTLLISPLAS